MYPYERGCREDVGITDLEHLSTHDETIPVLRVLYILFWINIQQDLEGIQPNREHRCSSFLDSLRI